MGASDLITRAVQHLRAIHVEGPFSDLADRLESIGADLSDVVFSLSRQIDMEEGVDDLDAINGRIHELDELTRRWGPTLADVIAWRDRAVLDVEMSIPAQFVSDVAIGVKERCPIHTCLCSGGNIMSREAVLAAAKKIMEGK